MSAAKGCSAILGYILGALYLVAVVAYFQGRYGAVGLFGSMLTMPFSAVWATLIWLFQGWGSAFVTVAWIGLTFMFLVLSND